MTEKEPKKASPADVWSDLFCRCTPADENWLMAASCIAVTFLTGGTLRSTGVLFVLFREQFGLSREEAAWPLSLSAAAVAFSGVLCQILLRWCARGQVMLCASFCQVAGIFAAHFAPNFPMLAAAFGIAHGIGSGLVFVLAGSFINRHFTTKRRLIMFLNIGAFCGAGVVFPGLLLFVAGTFGPDKVLLFCGGLLLNVPILSVFMRPFEMSEDSSGDTDKKSGVQEPSSSDEKYSSLVKQPESSTESILTKPLFYVTALTHIFFFYVINLIATVAIDAALWKDIPITLAVVVVPAASVFDCIGRVALPMVSDAGYVTQPVLIAVDYAVVATGLLILSMVRDYPRMFLAGVSMGAFNGHATAVHSSMMAEAVGSSKLAKSNNFVTCVASLAFLSKPFVIGYLRDAHGGYRALYHVASGIILFNALLWFAVIVTLARIRSKTWTASDKLIEDRDAPSLVTYRSVDLTSLMA